jgi:hypothetical protein
MGQKIITRAVDGEKDIQSPYHPDGKMLYKYVMVDEESRIGYLLIWCSQTLNGINVSRVKVPDGKDYILGKDIENAISDEKIPLHINFVKINREIWF